MTTNHQEFTVDTNVDQHVADAEKAILAIQAVADQQKVDLAKKEAFLQTVQAAIVALKS